MEKELGITIQQVELKDIDENIGNPARKFSLDENDSVIGLRLDSLDLKPVVKIVAGFKCLVSLGIGQSFFF